MEKMKGRDYCLDLMRAAGVPVSDPQMRRVFKEQLWKDLYDVTTMIISRGKEDQVHKYKDRKGNNVLHALLSYFTKIHVDWKGLVASVQLLLNLGVDAKDKDLFIGRQEFVVGYSKAPEQPQSSARPICHSNAMTNTGREPATICIAA